MTFLSDYGDVPDISPRLSITSLFFCIFTSLIVTSRLAVCYFQQARLQIDDITILISALFADALGVLLLLCCAAGFGKHTANLDQPTITKTLKLFYLSQILYKLSLSTTKLSILSLYRRLFSVHTRFKWICDALAALVLAWMIAAFFATVFQCTPITYAYNRAASNGRGSCIDLQASWYANAVFNITSDFLITLLPMPVIRSLQINTREKFMLCALFALGFLVCCTSILRATTINLAGSAKDRTWYSVNSSMWSVFEANLAITGACMPVLKKPITRMLGLGSNLSTIDAGSYDRCRPSAYIVQPTILSTTTASTPRTNRFSLTRSSSKRVGDSGSEDGILRDDDVQLRSITKTREVHMVSEAGDLGLAHHFV